MFLALVFDVAAALVGGFVVGYWLDSHFKTFPWLTTVFFIGGIAAGINTGIFMVRKYKKTLTEK
jgi:F0F1-type ATP synthase assembly protein I